MRFWTAAFLGLSVGIVACGGAGESATPVVPVDAGDAGDAGAPDAEAPVEDAAAPATDAEPVPSPVDRPAITCTDALDDVYVAPKVLAPMSPTLRGDVVRCAPKGDLDPSAVQARLDAKSIAMKALYGVHEYRVAFRTYRSDGTPAISTARVILPDTKAPTVEAVLVAHPTDGIADGCVPSKKESANDELALGWATLGRPVIVPDYVGLGNDGVQGYLDNVEQGRTMLDSGRALDDLLAHGPFGRILVVGYSQGGGAALSAQALEKSWGTSGKLVGIVAFAPEWPIDMKSFGYESLLANPNQLTVTTGLSKSSIAVLRAYAYFANRVGAANATDGFPQGQRAGFQNAIESLCLVPLGGYLQGTALKLGDLVDDGLRTGLLSCVQTNGATCTGAAKGYWTFLQSNVLASDPSGAPVVIVQGMLDQILPAGEEAACIQTKMIADGRAPEVCVDATATHQSIVGAQGAFGLAWGLAALGGKPHPTCGNTKLPACSRP